MGWEGSDVHPGVELGRGELRGPQPGRAAEPDRRQEPGGLHLHDRPAGPDPRARHEGAQGDLDGRFDAEPRERGAPGRRRQPLPKHAPRPRGRPLHRDTRTGPGGRHGDAAATQAAGLARAKGYEAQIRSLGAGPTAAVAIANAVSEGKITVVPEVLVTGGGGAIEGLAATFMRTLNGNHGSNGAEVAKPAAEGKRADS